MTGIMLAGIVGLLAALGAVALGDMASGKVRGQLDRLPHAVLRLAARRLDPELRETFYEAEWLPELIYILRGGESRPVIRLIHGTRYAVGILVAESRIANLPARTRRWNDMSVVGPLLIGLSAGLVVVELGIWLVVGLHAMLLALPIGVLTTIGYFLIGIYSRPAQKERKTRARWRGRRG